MVYVEFVEGLPKIWPGDCAHTFPVNIWLPLLTVDRVAAVR